MNRLDTNRKHPSRHTAASVRLSVAAVLFVGLWLLLGPAGVNVGVWPAARADVPARVLAAERQRVETIQRVAPTVVAIFASGAAGGGSGVLVSPDGLALTNFHVVAATGPFMKCGLNDGRVYDAVLVGLDPTGDVALIRLLGRDDFAAAQLGDSDTVQVGDWVFALGNPFLLATDFQPTVTYGMVSGVHRYQYPAGTVLEYTDCIQVDASINPGNSGGPLFDYHGRLIGINGRISTDKRGRVNSGVGYAISINQIKNFWDHLRSGRIVDHATLGATVRTQADGSVIVDSILESSDAYRRGLRLGDEVVAFGGRPIGSANEFKNVLGIFPAGWKVPLVFRREGVKRRIVVRLERLHKESAFATAPRLFEPHGPPRPDRRPERDPRKEQPPGPERRRPDHHGPAPHPLQPHRPKQPKVPEKYKHLFVEKPGFANYYFNQVQQQRLRPALEQWGDFSKQTGPWVLSGTDESGRSFEFTLTDQAAGLLWGDDAFYLDLNKTPLQEEPAGSGGLLVALTHLRRLLVRGPQSFTECYYLGSEPLDGTEPRVDVLVTTLAESRTHWYFARQPLRLVGFDTWPAPDVDPCEVRFEQLQEFQGRRLPARLQVRHGDQQVGAFQLKKVEFKKLPR